MPFPKVLDLSHHNQVNSFEMLVDYGVRGVILKATQGVSYVDPTYAQRKAAAAKAGLLVGAYHFATADDTAKQLDHFLSVAELGARDCGALDYEPNLVNGAPAGDMSLADARDWLENYEVVMGRKAKFYSGSLIKQTLTGPDAFLNSHDLWLAQYGPTPHLPVGWSRYWLWQYSEKLPVPGVTGNVDANSFDGTDQELAASWR